MLTLASAIVVEPIGCGGGFDGFSTAPLSSLADAPKFIVMRRCWRSMACCDCERVESVESSLALVVVVDGSGALDVTMNVLGRSRDIIFF